MTILLFIEILGVGIFLFTLGGFIWTGLEWAFRPKGLLTARGKQKGEWRSLAMMTIIVIVACLVIGGIVHSGMGGK